MEAAESNLRAANGEDAADKAVVGDRKNVANRADETGLKTYLQ